MSIKKYARSATDYESEMKLYGLINNNVKYRYHNCRYQIRKGNQKRVVIRLPNSTSQPRNSYFSYWFVMQKVY